LAQNRSSTDQIILPAVTAPSATAIVTVAQVVVIKLDRVQDIGEHAAVMGLVGPFHRPAASKAPPYSEIAYSELTQTRKSGIRGTASLFGRTYFEASTRRVGASRFSPNLFRHRHGRAGHSCHALICRARGGEFRLLAQHQARKGQTQGTLKLDEAALAHIFCTPVAIQHFAGVH
jgi:hypothetical protein